jgi:hemerythrin
MPLFIWTEALATGSAFIDDDHHILVEKVNAVLEAISHGSEPAILQSAIDELETHSREHFGVEEAQMLRIDFPGLEAHRANHALLLKQLTKFNSELIAGKTIDPMKAYDFITRWVKDHIVHFDRDLANTLKTSLG